LNKRKRRERRTEKPRSRFICFVTFCKIKTFGPVGKTVEHGLAVDEGTGHFVGMPKLDRITFDSSVMGGKPCIRGLRVTVGTLVGLFASGKTREDILGLYPYLEAADLDAALTYAAWRSEEQDVAVSVA